MNGLYQGMAVVLIERWPNFWFILKLSALCKTLPSLTVPFKAAHEHSLKLQRLCANFIGSRFPPILTQANTLPLTQITELVVIVGAK